MVGKKDVVNLENSNDILKDIVDSFYDIPFGNSQFQIEKFIIANNITPERAYRSIGLELHSKLQNLLDEKYNRILLEFEMKIKEKQIQELEEGSYERLVLEIEREKLLQKLPFADKLINDTIQECNILYSWYKKFPKYTREQFEEGEYKYYLEKSKREVIGMTGARESIFNMLEDISGIKETIEKMKNSDPAEWPKIRNEITNALNLEIDSRPDKVEQLK